MAGSLLQKFSSVLQYMIKIHRSSSTSVSHYSLYRAQAMPIGT